MTTYQYIRYPGSVISGSVTAVVSGTVNSYPAGLRNGGRVTEVPLNSATWTALPTTPLANRNAISIQNPTTIEIKVNYSAGIAGYVGMIIAGGGERFYDITDAIPIYAKSMLGTPTLNVEELS